MRATISSIGRVPAQRTTTYGMVKVFNAVA